MKRIILLLLSSQLAFSSLSMAEEDIIPRYEPGDELNITPVILPQTTSKTLKNGLKVTVVQDHEIPTVNYLLAIYQGALADAPGKEGQAQITAGLLDRGTTTRTREQIDEEMDFMASGIAGYVGWHASYVRAGCLKKYNDDVLNILADVILNPTFPEEEMQKQIQRSISGIMRRSDSPEWLLNHTQDSLIYQGSRYSIAEGGSIESLSAITRDDLVQYHRAHYLPNNAELVVVGDVKPRQVFKQVKKVFGGWEKGQVVSFHDPQVQAPENPQILIVEKPDATQVQIAMGHLSVPRNNPDYAPLQVMNYIMGGGGFASRLMKRVRSELGLTYGIYSHFNYNRETGDFRISTSTKHEDVRTAIDESIRQIKLIQDEPITEKELRDAKAYLAGSYVLNFETPQTMAARIISGRINGMPEDYITRYTDEILSVTREDVQRVAQEYLHPGSFQITLVGQEALLQPELKGLGAIHVVAAH